MLEAIKAGLAKLFTPTTWIGVAALLGMALLYVIFVELPAKATAQGQIVGQAECVTTAASAAVSSTVAGAASAASKAEGDIKRGNAASAQREVARDHIDTFFRNLDAEARHDQPNPADACVLPADRLRRWAAANAGPAGSADPDDQGEPTRQLDAGAPASAQAPLGGATGPGGRPQGGGQAVPPAGSTDVRPAVVPGDRAP